MPRGDRLLLQRLHRDGVDLLVAIRFSYPLGVRAIRLVPADVATHVVSGQQPHGMAERLKLAPAGVGRPASLEDGGRRRLLRDEREEAIPGADRAVLDAAKVQQYLLSREHPIGGAKARFFSQLGFDQNNWTVLRDALHRFAGREAQVGPATGFGQKYLVHGTITGPSGRAAGVVVVWIVLTDEDFPRFVTAYPGAKP